MDLAACKYQILSSPSLYPFLGYKTKIKLWGFGNKEGMCRADECVQNRRKCSSCVEREEELLYQIHPHPWWFSQNHEPNTAQRTKHFSTPSSQLVNPSQDVPWNKFPWKNRILTLWRRGLGRKCTIFIPSFINHLCNAKLCPQPRSLPWTPSSPSFPAGKSSEPGLRVLCIPRAFPGH